MNFIQWFFNLFSKINEVSDGFIPSEPEPEDWEFGSDLSMGGKIILANDSNWINLLVKEEKQRKSIETMACVSFSALSIIEMIIKAKYGVEENFSDRFTAKMSNTSRAGNTFQRVSESIRKDGFVKEESYMYPDNTNWNEFYKSIDNTLILEGQSNLNRYKIQHEWVNMRSEKAVKKALQFSPIQVGVFAWARNSRREYYLPQGRRYNHATVIINTDKQVFDSYEPHVKQLDAGYSLYRWGKIYNVEKIRGDSPEEKLHQRLLGKLIITPHRNGEVYRVHEDHLQKVAFVISDKKLFEKVHRILKKNKAFLGISNENFDLLVSRVNKVVKGEEAEVKDEILLKSLYE